MSLSRLVNETPFIKPIGIELTFVPKNPLPYHKNPASWDYAAPRELHIALRRQSSAAANRSCTWEALTRRYAEAARQHWVPGSVKRCPWSGQFETVIYNDPGCVEFPSPILRSWEQVETWYKKATAAAETVGLVTYHEEQEGGAGHIHMGKLTTAQKLYIIAETYKHPFLSWVFISPNQNFSCCSIASMLDRILQYSTHLDQDQVAAKKLYQPSFPGPRNIILDGLYNNKDSILNVNGMYNTLEWRAFDSAFDWREQARCVAFYQRLAAYAIKNKVVFKEFVNPTAMLKLYQNDFELCCRQFKRLIETLGLPWREYSPLIELNLKPAFEWGLRT